MTKKTAQTKAKATKKKGKKKMDMKELAKLKEDYEKTLREKGQEIMKGAVLEFFKANPKITGVVWTQYTPYFNDGEPCEFRVGDASFSVEEVDPETAEDAEEGDGGTFFNHYSADLFSDADVQRYGAWAAERNEQLQKAFAVAEDKKVFVKASKSFAETIGVAPEDLFLAAFGDHVKVVLTPEQIYTEEYSHD